MKKLENRVAIVTGGGRGIGKTIALRLAREGADVVVIGPNVEDLDRAAEEIRSLGRLALGVVADVRREDEVSSVAAQVHEVSRFIDILVNNAAVIGPTGPVAEVSRSEWDDVLAVNLTGAMLCSKAVLPDMMARRRGKIINISSVAGKLAYALRSPYAVSKWGLIGLTLTLAKEVAEYNIQVNAVCPGPVRGQRMQRIFQQRAAELRQSVQEVERTYVEATALNRMVEADDVAALVAFLASDESNNITGQAIDVSAGYGL